MAALGGAQRAPGDQEHPRLVLVAPGPLVRISQGTLVSKVGL